jgi:pimeloyl-ACP methyl ester carboxylesterase
VKLRTLALAAGGLAAGYAAERVVLGRERHRPDQVQLASFRLPDDARHVHVPTSDGGELHVVERGQGRPLLFLHGVTLSALTWHYQLLDLPDRFRVLAADHRGHGTSRAGEAGWGIGRLGLDVRELLEALDLHDCVLVGHSMGGMAVLQFAVDHPDVVRSRVAGIVLMSTTAGPVHRLAAWRAVADLVTPSAKRGLALAGRIPGGVFPSSDLSYLIFRLGMGTHPSPTHIELNRLMTAATPVSVLGELIDGVLSFDLRDRLGEINVPSSVLVGTRDLLTPPSAGRELVAGLPESRPLEVFPGAGHMLMLERREEVNERIERFAKDLA